MNKILKLMCPFTYILLVLAIITYIKNKLKRK